MDYSAKSDLKPLFIIGFMASGKTTFGRALASALNRDFIDLDFYIEQRFRKSIPDIFRTEGEESFRKKEAAMLREVGEFQNVIIACGGGTPCFMQNMEYMNNTGISVLLETDPQIITDRLILNNRRRPLMAGKAPDDIKAETERGIAERQPFYSAANIRFSGDALENLSQINHSVENFISLYSEVLLH